MAWVDRVRYIQCDGHQSSPEDDAVVFQRDQQSVFFRLTGNICFLPPHQVNGLRERYDQSWQTSAKFVIHD